MSKDGIIDVLSPDKFIILQDDVVAEEKAGALGVYTNKIVEIPNFIDPEVVPNLINFFENCDIEWGDVSFYNSSGKGILTDSETMKKFELPDAFFDKLKNKYQEAVELVFEKKVRANTSHAQKWTVGGFADPHSDNCDHEGIPNAFEINKYVGILYLNDNYEGGNLFFCDKEKKWEPYLSFKPNAYSYYVFPGGYENIHGVSEITSGTRYTMVSFWDFADLEYDESTLEKWKEKEKQARIEQAEQKKKWQKEQHI
jgi:hypothetical protein